MICLNEDFYNESVYNQLYVIDYCYEALDEGIFDSRVIDTALTYTYSSILEILENVKEYLLQLCSTVLSALNNYILNTAKYVERYREILKERVRVLKEPFIYDYYEYKFTDYPNIVKASAGDITRRIESLQSDITTKSYTEAQIEDSVDNTLRWFTKLVLGVSADPDNLKNSVTEIVSIEIRGQKQYKGIDESTIDKFVTNIASYRDRSAIIKKTKTMIVKEYEALKSAYRNAIKTPDEVKKIDRYKAASDPGWYAFMISEQSRFKQINIQMNRLFNGFITVYESALNTKLNILKEQVDRDREILTELLTRTQLIPLINTKRIEKNRKPFEYEKKLYT